MLLAEKLGRGNNAINKRSSLKKEIYCVMVPMVKYTEIF